MEFKGNNFYPNIEVNTKEEAVKTILRMLNNYQCGWEVVYVEELLEAFKLNKEDFILFDLSYYYGAYSAYYKPNHTQQELNKIELEIRNHYYWDLFINTAEKLKECKDAGMNYLALYPHVTSSDLKYISGIASSYLRNISKYEAQKLETVSASENKQ